MSTNLKIFRNVASNYLIVGTLSLANLVLAPVLYRKLGAQQYGLFVFAYSCYAVSSIFDLGIPLAAIRRIGGLIAYGPNAESLNLARASFWALTCLGLLVGTVLAASGKGLGIVFKLPVALTQKLIALIGLQLAFDFSVNGIVTALEAHSEFARPNLLDSGITVLRTTCVVLVVMFAVDQKLISVVLVFVGFSVLRIATFLWLALHFDAAITRLPGKEDWARIVSMSKESAIIWQDQSAKTLWLESVDFFITKLNGIGNLGLFAIVQKIPMGLQQMTRPAMGVAYPLLSSAATRQDDEALQRFLIVSTRAALGISLSIALPLFIWASPILMLWVGRPTPEAVPVFRALLLCAVSLALSQVPVTSFYASEHAAKSLSISAATTVLTLALSGWILKRYGLVGVSLLLAAVQTASVIAMYAWLIRLRHGSPARLLQRSIAPVLLALAAAAIWGVVLVRWGANTPVWMVLSCLSTFAVFWVVLALRFGSMRLGFWNTARENFLSA